jgi:hypothetical protein
MAALSEEIELAIATPHPHEDPIASPPLWLIWADHKNGDGWSLECVANSADNCRYAIRCYAENLPVIVERIPANHNFASSVREFIADANHRIAAQSYRRIHGYRRDGD